LITGKATVPLSKVKQGNQWSTAAEVSIIWKRTMARAHKAAGAVAQANKDRQFKAYQQELGILLENNGEESASSTP
jgi:hypothetical protein